MIIVIAALLLIGALFFTLRVRDKDLPLAESDTPAKPLEEAKARIYENLRDLQFEYRVGKLSDADYQASKLELQNELARVLAQLDRPSAAAPAPAAPQASTGLKCPHCGAVFEKKLKFCGECGKSMEASS